MAEKKKIVKTAKSAKPAEAVFSKAQIVNSERFANRRDILSALLADGKEYTLSEAERMMEDYMKGKVK